MRLWWWEVARRGWRQWSANRAPQAPIMLEGSTGVRVDGPRQWLSFDIDDVVRQVYGLTAAQPLAAEGTDRG